MRPPGMAAARRWFTMEHNTTPPPVQGREELAQALKDRALTIARKTGDEPEAVEALERAVLAGDLSRLTPIQRAAYYWKTCRALGLNPYTQPFRFLALNGGLIMYATRDATDQLRRLHRVSIDDVTVIVDGDVIEAQVSGHTPDGRQDADIGCVPIPKSVDKTADARMKAVTKAKRRLTLSLVGLGMMSEEEAEDLGGVPVAAPTADELQAVEPEAAPGEEGPTHG